MQLPFRIQTEPGVEPVISVDGAFGAPGLNLSHWPGHTTPPELSRDTSTEIVLAFNALPDARRAELTRDCAWVVNNHVDTDGVCAAFALLHPDEARARAPRLVAAAQAGDFFRVPDEAAFVTDCIVAGLVDAERSPWRERYAGASDRERRELATLGLLEQLPRVLDEPQRFEALWQEPLVRLAEDRARLASCAQDDLVHLDFHVWSAPPSVPDFDPGRHALFGSTEADRVLVAAPSAGGSTYRLLIGTLSWFDLARFVQPRPDLPGLAARLNELEGTEPSQELAWRHQDPRGASPELWFGRADHPAFAEHAAAVLAPSALDVTRVKACVLDALRAVFVFPDEDE